MLVAKVSAFGGSISADDFSSEYFTVRTDDTGVAVPIRVSI